MKQFVILLLTTILSNEIVAQKTSRKKIKIEREKIDVCGTWNWVGSREGYETSTDSFKLASTTVNDNPIFVYTRFGKFSNKIGVDSIFYGDYKVDNATYTLTWNEGKVNERRYKILYYNNKDIFLSWELEGIIVTYYLRRIKKCE